MATVVMLAPTGCLGGADEEPRPATGAPAAVAGVVDRLETAVAARDFATVCGELFTTGARERAGGEECERRLRSAAEGVERPTIEVRRIDVSGERATVEVVTDARGQARVTDELRLRREGGGWRIEALG
jgi:Putative lumazine-binding